MGWKTLKSTEVYSHPRLSVIVDEVLLPNGEQTTYIRYGKRPEAAEVIAIRDDGLILLQREYSYPMNAKLYQFPGGAGKPGESAKQIAAREFAEETGLKGKLQQIGWFYPDNRRSKARMYVFVATNLQKAAGVKDAEEEFEDFWLTREEINEMITKNKILNYTALTAWAFFMNAPFYKT